MVTTVGELIHNKSMSREGEGGDDTVAKVDTRKLPSIESVKNQYASLESMNQHSPSHARSSSGFIFRPRSHVRSPRHSKSPVRVTEEYSDQEIKHNLFSPPRWKSKKLKPPPLPAPTFPKRSSTITEMSKTVHIKPIDTDIPIGRKSYVLSPLNLGYDEDIGDTNLAQEDLDYLEKNDAVSPSVFMLLHKWREKSSPPGSFTREPSTPGVTNGQKTNQEIVGEWIGEAIHLLEDFAGRMEKDDAGFFENNSKMSSKFKRIAHLLGKAKTALAVQTNFEDRLPQIMTKKKKEDDKIPAEVSEWLTIEYGRQQSVFAISRNSINLSRKSSTGNYPSCSNLDEGTTSGSSITAKSSRSKTLSSVSFKKKDLSQLIQKARKTQKTSKHTGHEQRVKMRSYSDGNILPIDYCMFLFLIFFLPRHLIQIIVQKGPDVLTKLLQSSSWDFDIFLFGELCQGRPLQTLVEYLFQSYRLVSAYDIDTEILGNFLRELESGYLDVAYHNNYHAADVVQSMHVYFSSSKFNKLILLEDILAGLVAAAIHDVGHPGNNNHFEIAAFSPLAVAYNDRSVLENFHLATGFRILQKSECNIFCKLSLSDRRKLRESIISMVLATDMQQHMHLVAKLEATIEQKRAMNTWFSANDLDDRRTLLNISIHTADISTAAKKLPVALEWAHRIHEEFWIQGDKERRLNLPVTAVMDRNRPNLQKSQIGFITIIADPLFKVMVEVCPEIKGCIQQQNRNLSYWKARVELLSDIRKCKIVEIHSGEQKNA